jgi:Ca2+-binding EF-hand superfamily protein
MNQPVLLDVTADEGTLLSPEQEEQIAQVFKLFDTDDSGVLDESELHSAMFALGYLSDYHDNLSVSRDVIGLKRSDGIGSASVTKEEFRNIMRGSLIGRGGMEEIRMTFESIVSISATFAKNGLKSSNENSMAQVPDNQQGGLESADVSVHESGLPSLQSSSATSPPVTPKLKKRFRVGKAGAGVYRASITFDKLRLACQRYDVKLSDEELKGIILETDRDHSGDVDWDEYVNILKHSCWF